MQDDIFFILGVGPSVDSGLPTYRWEGVFYNKYNTPERLRLVFLQKAAFAGLWSVDHRPEFLYSYREGSKFIWEFKYEFYKQIQQNKTGPTYQIMNEIIRLFPDSFILT